MTRSSPCRVVAVLPAAGRGLRFGGSSRKQFRRLGGRTILGHSAAALLSHHEIDGLVLVLPEGEAGSIRIREMVPDGSPVMIRTTIGGPTRQASVLEGLEAAKDWAPEIVLIHDGVRPLVTRTLICRVIEGARECGAAVPVLEISDTIKEVDLADRVTRTLDRRLLRTVQTPEGFRFETILHAARRAQKAGKIATDTSSLVQWDGHPIKAVAGEQRNIKITYPEDETYMRRILSGSERPNGDLRVGTGYDAHVLIPGRPLVLGGVSIPFDRGLHGHSDADVLIHALIDALLGAAGLGDIGIRFPDSDSSYAGISSLALLQKVSSLLEEAGWRPVNADAVIVAQAPAISPHAGRMVKKIAEILRLAPCHISVKASTTEGMGFEGRGEGMSARVTVLISRRGTAGSGTGE